MINSFTDLRVWQSSRVLVKIVYDETSLYPKNELYGLVSQMRRAAISISSNIAEGFRRSSTKDREHFYVIASGSLYELKNQIILSADLGFIDNSKLTSVSNQVDITHKQPNALLKAHRSKNSGISNV